MAKLISTFTDPQTGDIVGLYDDDTERVLRKGTLQRDSKLATDTIAGAEKAEEWRTGEHEQVTAWYLPISADRKNRKAADGR
jgi:hypothetical protein